MSREWSIGRIGLQPSFGFGDRIGMATPGHIRAARKFLDILPVFAQQSIREMSRTGRDPERVMADATAAMDAETWIGLSGADADHLKTEEDVDRTAAAGFVFFTIDPSDHVDEHADEYDERTLREKHKAIAAENDWLKRYGGSSFQIENGTSIEIDEESAMRAAVKYGRAVSAAVSLYRHIAGVQDAAGREYEIELSVDETEQPTSAAEHWIVAEQCQEQGMKLVSLAPRFVGRLEKGVDYIGDEEMLETTVNEHAAIARALGPYKLGLHSGSDKLSMYGLIASATRGLFHVKTAGTSYLEALRTVAVEQPGFFREICSFARSRYDEDKATYHVHAELEDTPAPEETPNDRDLINLYLESWDDVPKGRGFAAPGRQILHCTFGSVLTHPEFGPRLKSCLQSHAWTYSALLETHFEKHLTALAAGLDSA